MIKDIDVGKCIGCRKGIGLFIKENGDEFIHVDLFATYEAGESYHCQNQEAIREHLKENEGKGTYLPDEELEEFYHKQADWWDDAIELMYELFVDHKKVNDFLNEGKKNNKMWNQSNQVIEDALFKIAEKQNYEVTEEKFPYLLKWQSK